MKRLDAAISMIVTLIIVTSCGLKHTVSEDIASAEIAFANEDVNATRDICNGILDKNEKRSIEASQYARLSIIYMQLNDQTDDPEDIELAAECYREAFKLNADSAMSFYRSLPVEQDKYAMTLSAIVHILDNPREIPTDHDREVLPDEVGRLEETTLSPDSVNQ